MGRRPLAIAAAGLFVTAQASAHVPVIYEVEPDQVLATYEASIGAARISGASRSLEWSIGQVGNGESSVRLRLIVDSFETGHASFDAAIRSAMESRVFPVVEIEGTARPDGSSFRGTITMHGVSRPLDAKLLQSRVGDRLLLRASLTVALDSFGVSPPALATARMGNAVDVTVLGLLRVRPDSVLSGGSVRPRAR